MNVGDPSGWVEYTTDEENMAGSLILATARVYDATLWTQDEHFKDIEGVKYIEKKYK